MAASRVQMAPAVACGGRYALTSPRPAASRYLRRPALLDRGPFLTRMPQQGQKIPDHTTHAWHVEHRLNPAA